MNRTDTEDKLRTTAVETKLDAATCPEKPTHRLKLGQTCETCGTAIPMQMGFTPDEFERYFAPPRAEGPSHPFAPDEEPPAVARVRGQTSGVRGRRLRSR